MYVKGYSTLQCCEDARIALGGDDIEEMSSFEYLGSYLCNDGDVRKEVGIRIAKAGVVFSKMKNVWNNGKISLKTKLKLFNSIIISILMLRLKKRLKRLKIY